MKIAVIGGGIGGLCTALALENNGFEPVVFEAAVSFLPVGAGLSLSPNALDSLNVLGVKEAYLKQAKTYRTAYIKKQNGDVISRMDLERITAFTGGVFSTVHRHDLHKVLMDSLKKTTLHTGKRLRSFEQNNTGVLLTFEDDTVVEMDAVIAADGLHSVIRKQLLPHAQERFSGQVCWRGICPNYQGIKEMSESWGQGLRFGIVPLHGERIYWFAVKDADQEGQPLNAGRDELIKLFDGFHEPVTALIRSTETASIYKNHLNDLDPINRFAFGKILLLGDAAHATTPNLGQGACMAIEDAAFLQVILKQGHQLQEAFQLVEQQRIKRTTRIVNTSIRIGKLAQTTSKPAALLRNVLFKYAPFALNKPFYRFLFGYKVKVN